ncbi:MAG: ATP-binding protein [Bacteroidales bacterium]|nr:ATP-binding protein [Bacteroidales bacterium]
MNIYRNKSFWKVNLFLFAVLIGVSSLFYTRNLVKRLEAEERKKVEMWAEATWLISQADSTQNLDFLLSIMEDNTTVPVILTDGHDNIIAFRNFNPARSDDPGFMQNNLEKIKRKSDPIVVDLANGFVNHIYYKDSIILTQLIYYPFVQLALIILFILVSYIALSSSRQAEQNQVWVGMSKETAHQLGTPTSSLAGWIEILQNRYPDIPFSNELALDVERLVKVTERFSRIGSKPLLSPENIIDLIRRTVEYLKSRSSSKIIFDLEFDAESDVIVPVNVPLFEWVIENIAKNAIDAMEGEGQITVRVTENDNHAYIDISDTGKGIPKSTYRKIFNPGFTTKSRGWGLGLSLAKRIIAEYHNGKIFVRYSEVGKGSCIRIIMKKNHISG